MTGVFEDLTGKRFNRLTVIGKVKNTKCVTWECKCDCGKTIYVTTQPLNSGHTKSCGCFKGDKLGEFATTHGRSAENKRLYNMWRAMIDRCYNKSIANYKNYGERGISVCESWQDVNVFFEWALKNGYEKNLQIDRRNNDGNYCPENCHFVTASYNSRNQRVKKSNTTGFVGVSKETGRETYAYAINCGNKRYRKAGFPTAMECAKARDRVIVDNKLDGFNLNKYE